jgi:hypothetical protein
VTTTLATDTTDETLIVVIPAILIPTVIAIPTLVAETAITTEDSCDMSDVTAMLLELPDLRERYILWSSHHLLKAEPSKVLGVFGFSRKHTEIDLEDEFNRHGVVEKVIIIHERGTKNSKGFGFVTMSSVDEAIKAKVWL